MAKKTKQRTYKAKSDALYSKIIRSRGACERCHRSSGVQLQTAHLISRTFSKVRTNELNAFCLCSACHRYFHNFPYEFSRFITDRRGSEVYDELKAKANDTGKMDWESEYERLKGVWKSIE